ncbi:energy-coupling factor ABC transporter permease [uncultured Phascolarctobacterium sp.]|uniref:energy-coupling factor ABC transporter permease n=1 Tax=uncultured Phascolarctobacterium sp. TaxID=512296 RepID=UPI00260FE9D9|nr:energy-coupling factor ABC transporter permease [uncultured Phascolarctobacterium sp.]
MHMADALINPAVAATMYAASAAAAAYSIKKVREENNPRKIPLMGVMGAFVFATQMLNFTIPGTGSSGHLCGGLLLAALLGPYAAFLTMIGILTIQCLLFADGGLLALGANIWNMAFYGCFVGGLLIWQPIIRSKISKARIILASVLGSIITLQMGAFSVVLETTASGISELPFNVFAFTMQSIHLAIGTVEGLIISAVLLFVYQARPELLAGAASSTDGNLSFQKTLAFLGSAAALAAGVLSLAASEYPDGLEWSLEQVTGSAELESSGALHALAAHIQEITSLLPDYAFPNSESVWGTVFSGLAGSALVLLVCMACCYAFNFFKHKTA